MTSSCHRRDRWLWSVRSIASLDSMSRLTKLRKLLDPEIRSKNARALRHWVREQYFLAAAPSMPDPIFVTGCCRSGTTILAETIAASPHVLYLGYATPELWDGLYGPHH